MKRAPQNEPVFTAFRFRPIAGIRPAVYVSALYAAVLLLGLYFLFLDQGLRRPQVRLRFYVLAGAASLYVNGKFYHNLNFSPGWEASTVLIPAGKTELRIVKSGMEAWTLERDFQTNIWNNRWNPTTYSFEVKMSAAAGNWRHLWQEAWRGYLYRALEAQKEISFDASHPYPWVLSEGLRAVLYSGANRPAHWSADLQRGLASTTSIHQWGDLLSGYSLLSQSGSGGVGVLGPRSLAILARSAVKRLHRLEPGRDSLFLSWKKAMREESSAQQLSQAAFWRQYRSPTVRESSAETKLEAGPVLQFGGLRFISIAGQDFAWQQSQVSHVQFARFWFSEAGRKLRARPQIEGFASLVLYPEDRAAQPWDWPENADLQAILADPLLQDQPVRGITWTEAQAFAQWMNEQFGSQEWQLGLPRLSEHNWLARHLARATGGQRAEKVKLDFRIAARPPDFGAQMENLLGLKGLGQSLWEWHEGDYLPHRATASANGHSNLLYKLVSGASWLNALPLEEGPRDLWVSEFWNQANELPVAATYATVAGQFAGIRSPYTGFRLLARKK